MILIPILIAISIYVNLGSPYIEFTMLFLQYSERYKLLYRMLFVYTLAPSANKWNMTTF